jgi:hypothetical protein
MKYEIRVSELWHMTHEVEADSLEQAIAKIESAFTEHNLMTSNDISLESRGILEASEVGGEEILPIPRTGRQQVCVTCGTENVHYEAEVFWEAETEQYVTGKLTDIYCWGCGDSTHVELR